MDWTVFPAILTAITGVLIAFGGGIKWLLNRIDASATRDREWQNAERSKLETLFNERIDTLETRIGEQQAEIVSLRSDIRAYVRHVGVLEGLLKANALDVPPLQLPSDPH